LKIDSSFIRPFLKRVREQPVSLLMGCAAGETLVMAPACGPMEALNKMVWSRRSASWLFDIWRDECDVTDQDFIVIPLTFENDKPKKHTVALTKEIIAAAAVHPQIKRFVCIGTAPMKHIFGSVPGMQSMMGRPVQVHELGFKNVFTFPDLEAVDLYLEMEANMTRQLRKQREYWIAKAQAERVENQVRSILVKFRYYMEKI
jgi:hypothetical protein